MYNVRTFPQLLPSSIRKTIPENAPTFNSDDDSNIDWFNKYGFNKYKSIIFSKGPLLAISQFNNEITSPSSLLSINICKKNLEYIFLGTFVIN